MYSSKLAAVAALVLSSSPAFAFRDSSPLILWSSHPNEAIRETAEAITSGVIGAEEVYATISSLGCDWETLVVAHVEDLHQTHLPDLTLPKQDADLHIPYLIRPTSQLLDAGLSEWALLCGANMGYRLEDAYGNGRTIVKLDVDRTDDIASLASKIPSSHIILLTGTRQPPSSAQGKRQETERPFPSHTTTRAGQQPTGHRGASNSTNGPLLSRVQILTTPIITAALISFGVFIPIVVFGVYSLAGIQVPPRMLEIGKGLVVSKDRKDQ